MNFLLKIVEGPNKGAEIALVEGVAVTLGKGDDCDIVLADLTMPEAPVKIEANADGVAVDGEPIEPLSVKTFGATSFAVGPADAPWGELKWPKDGEQETGSGEPETGNGEPGTPEKPEAPEKPETPGEPEKPARKRGGRLGCIIVLLALLLAVIGVGLWFLGRGALDGRHANGEPCRPKSATISSIAAKYGLALAETNGVKRISGNLRTRRERLAATAEAYQAAPGVELDLSDDESFRSAAEDALFTLSEGALKVTEATNRVLKITGVSPSPAKLKKTLEALDADLAKLCNVDVSGVKFGAVAAAVDSGDAGDSGTPGIFAKRATARKARAAAPSFPVCGILTTPYPCLVMRDGRRLMEGAAIGDGVILKIEADSVVITNSAGRFAWKP